MIAAKNSVVKLKLVDQGTPAGRVLCVLATPGATDKLVSLEEFQEDVRRALGKSFGEFVEAGQSVNAANYRVYRVVVHGTSGGNCHAVGSTISWPIRRAIRRPSDFRSSNGWPTGSQRPTSRWSRRCGLGEGRERD